MSSGLLALLELLLVFGVVLGLATWQLVSLRREKRRSDEARRDDEPGDPPV
jgi:cytochrome oxidase assembly protein ShyY1